MWTYPGMLGTKANMWKSVGDEITAQTKHKHATQKKRTHIKPAEHNTKE